MWEHYLGVGSLSLGTQTPGGKEENVERVWANAQYVCRFKRTYVPLLKFRICRRQPFFGWSPVKEEITNVCVNKRGFSTEIQTVQSFNILDPTPGSQSHPLAYVCVHASAN